MKNEYTRQAEKFLEETFTMLYISKAEPQNKPLWIKENEKHGINYSIRLKNKKHCFDFNFWGSINDAENNKNPNAYDILACLSGSINVGDFQDFCDNFGYDNDSITAEKTYKEVLNESENIGKLWSITELEKLAEIQ